MRKGGLPPLQRSVINSSSFQSYIEFGPHTTAVVLIASDTTLRWSGGKPRGPQRGSPAGVEAAFLTCELAWLELAQVYLTSEYKYAVERETIEVVHSSFPTVYVQSL